MGDYLKRGAWTVCKFKGGLGKKEGGGVFERGELIPRCTLCAATSEKINIKISRDIKKNNDLVKY